MAITDILSGIAPFANLGSSLLQHGWDKQATQEQFMRQIAMQGGLNSLQFNQALMNYGYDLNQQSIIDSIKNSVLGARQAGLNPAMLDPQQGQTFSGGQSSAIPQSQNTAQGNLSSIGDILAQSGLRNAETKKATAEAQSEDAKREALVDEIVASAGEKRAHALLMAAESAGQDLNNYLLEQTTPYQIAHWMKVPELDAVKWQLDSALASTEKQRASYFRTQQNELEHRILNNDTLTYANYMTLVANEALAREKTRTERSQQRLNKSLAEQAYENAGLAREQQKTEVTKRENIAQNTQQLYEETKKLVEENKSIGRYFAARAREMEQRARQGRLNADWTEFENKWKIELGTDYWKAKEQLDKVLLQSQIDVNASREFLNYTTAGTQISSEVRNWCSFGVSVLKPGSAPYSNMNGFSPASFSSFGAFAQ